MEKEQTIPDCIQDQNTRDQKLRNMSPGTERRKMETEQNRNCGAEGMCLGMCFGTALGTAFGHYAGVGLSLGMLIGLAVGMCIHKAPENTDK